MISICGMPPYGDQGNVCRDMLAIPDVNKNDIIQGASWLRINDMNWGKLTALASKHINLSL
jgi:hypothetical protein